MLAAVATVYHRVSTFDKSLSVTVISGCVITALMAAFSVWHCVTDEITMHSVLFVIALVEYLTSEDAGQPLGSRFAWPVNVLVNCQAGTKNQTNIETNGLFTPETYENRGLQCVDGGDSKTTMTVEVDWSAGLDGGVDRAAKSNGNTKKGI
ncbi:alkaline phytoceramidase [Diplocarpon rosae]|nr:alkaline phytoceramidase [Diplocarpon rosae]